MFGFAVRQTCLHLRGMTTGAPPQDTATAALGAGTSRRLPLRAYCYQVVIGYNRVAPLTLYGRPRLQESDSSTTRNLSTPITTPSPKCNPTRT